MTRLCDAVIAGFLIYTLGFFGFYTVKFLVNAPALDTSAVPAHIHHA